MNTAITKANLREILPLSKKAAEWGVDISYSAYTALRTGNEDYCLNNGEDLEILRQAINELIILKKQGTHLVNPELTLRDTLKFFEQGYMPNCKAGIRFLVVMPDGSLVPCSLHRSKYATRKDMIEKFSRTNRCGSCYVAIRSYSEMSFLSHTRNLPKYIQQMVLHREIFINRSWRACRIMSGTQDQISSPLDTLRANVLLNEHFSLKCLTSFILSGGWSLTGV